MSAPRRRSYEPNRPSLLTSPILAALKNCTRSPIETNGRIPSLTPNTIGSVPRLDASLGMSAVAGGVAAGAMLLIAGAACSGGVDVVDGVDECCARFFSGAGVA